MREISVIIPIAGPSRRMRSFGPKPLLLLKKDGRTILRRQLDLIRSACPKADVVVVVGFEADKIIKSLPSWVKVVQNPDYETTGVARSIALGLSVTSCKRAIVISGDLVFDKKLLDKLVKFYGPAIVYEKKGKHLEEDPGIIIDQNAVVNVEYGLPNKFAKIFQLCSDQILTFIEVATKETNRPCLSHEILNVLINCNMGFLAFENEWKPVVPINSAADLKVADIR